MVKSTSTCLILDFSVNLLSWSQVWLLRPSTLAGYHIELAGGGHYNAAALRSKVAEIQKQIPAGVGIMLNSLYINPCQFTFQLPLWQEMRKEGLQKIIQIMRCMQLTQAKSWPLLVMRPFVKLLTTLLPAPRPCLRLLIIMLMYVLTFQPHPFQFLMHLQGLRYVCAGKLIALQTMTNVLNYLKVKKIDFTKVNTSFCSNFSIV